MRRGEFSILYSEGPANRSEIVFDRRPITQSNGVDGILDEPGESDRFVQKRGEILWTMNLSKSELSLRVFSESREFRTTAEGDPLDDEEYRGISFRWRWRFGTRTSLGIWADFADRNRAEIDDKVGRYLLDISYEINRSISVRVEGVRSWQEDSGGRGTPEYTENQIRLYLRASF
jgi:hypothetical protein